VESGFDSFHHPPAPQAYDLVEVSPSIQTEARRQLEAFYPVMDSQAEERTLRTIETGIWSMLRRGAARIEARTVVFWNPVEAGFQPYDEGYNELMVRFLRDFKQRYQRGMQRKASYN